MNPNENIYDKGIPKLKSYLSAILNVNEKKILFLPCYAGYLIFVDKKEGFCLWVHKQTIEGILRLGFDLITDEFLYKLIYGGSVLKEIVKGVIPDPPKTTIVFQPGLHRIEYGLIVPEEGASGFLVKGIKEASNIVNKTGKGLINIFDKGKNNESKKEESSETSTLIKEYSYIIFQDFLYLTLSKERMFGSLSINKGFEFRSLFTEEAEEFMKRVKKSGFTTQFNGTKGYI